ncbi:MAG: hypothetical protein SGI86_19665 [Deltaproteobacteria bacterium]|nr:hypothetical protein [Deltaproteobacteria bacterium]
MKPSRLATCLALMTILVVGWVSVVHGTIMVEVPLDTLLVRADLAVRGTVLRTGTRVSIREGVLDPKTHVWIRVDEVLAGTSAPPVVHLIEEGGRYEGVETVVSGSPRYAAGEEVVVFLIRIAGQADVFATLEMTQGKFRIVKDTKSGDRLMVRDYSEVSMARWRRKRLEISEASVQKPIPLDTLKSRVRVLRLSTGESSELPQKGQR